MTSDNKNNNNSHQRENRGNVYTSKCSTVTQNNEIQFCKQWVKWNIICIGIYIYSVQCFVYSLIEPISRCRENTKTHFSFYT